MKTCVSCKIEKPVNQFAHDKNRPSPRKKCKDCRYKLRDTEKEKKRHREYMRERRIKDPDGVRINWERSKYGMAKEDFGYLECWVCGQKDKLHIDHCHTKNTPRGILCHGCNISLGLLREDPKIMERLIKYVKDGPHFELDRRAYPAT